MIRQKLLHALTLFSVLIACTLPTVSLAELEMETRGNNERTKVERVSAVITKIDPASREITLRGSLGNFITLTAAPEVSRLDEFAVGDTVLATYASSISGELRTPTAAELADPVVELSESAIAGADMPPGAAVGRSVRAVCTIEGMNRIAGTIMLKDPEGDFHLIQDIAPEKMAGVTLGQTIIVTYTEAFALSLEKQATAE